MSDERRSVTIRIPNVALASEARRRMPQPWVRIVSVGATVPYWVLQEAPRHGPGDVIGRFENQNGRFKVVAT